MSKSKTVFRLSKIVALGASVFALSAQAQDIKIGYTADQSASGVAELGIAGRWGFEAAIEDINKAGGILGRKVVGVIRDDMAALHGCIAAIR